MYLIYKTQNNTQSAYAIQILQNMDGYGPFQDTSTILQHVVKGLELHKYFGTILHSVVQLSEKNAYPNNTLDVATLRSTLSATSQVQHATT